MRPFSTGPRHAAIGLAKLISIGNKADLDECDFVSALAADPDTAVIVAYLESIASGKEFVQAAAAVAAVKPVVVLKAGTSGAGARAASSHTGSLAGADIAYGAAFSCSGILRAATFEALFDYATALAMQPLPQGNRVAVITNAGGPGIMAADALENCGLQVAALSPGRLRSCGRKLPPAARVDNPIDVLGDADPDATPKRCSAAQDDESVDAMVVLLDAAGDDRPGGHRARRLPNATAATSRCWPLSWAARRSRRAGRNWSAPAAGVFGAGAGRGGAAGHVRLCPLAPHAAAGRHPLSVNRRRVERVLHRCQRAGESFVNEAATKEIMRAYRFNVPEGVVATSAEEAIDAAMKLGFPVAMKILSPDLVHKSDVGGVDSTCPRRRTWATPST